MPMGDFFGALRRRWLVVLVGILLTTGVSAAAYLFFKPTYETTATVLMLPPQNAPPGTSANPYLRLDGLQQAADLVGVMLTDQAIGLELKAISKDVAYTVRSDPGTSSPLLVIDAKDSSPETALKIRDILVARTPVRLEAMQSVLGVDAKDRVTSTVVTLDTEAQEVGRNRLRAAVVAGAAGLALTLATAAIWDARRSRRPRRPASDIESVEPDDSGLTESEPSLPETSEALPETSEALLETSEASPSNPVDDLDDLDLDDLNPREGSEDADAPIDARN